jgi:hypothetical protein
VRDTISFGLESFSEALFGLQENPDRPDPGSSAAVVADEMKRQNLKFHPKMPVQISAKPPSTSDGGRPAEAGKDNYSLAWNGLLKTA